MFKKMFFCIAGCFIFLVCFTGAGPASGLEEKIKQLPEGEPVKDKETLQFEGYNAVVNKFGKILRIEVEGEELLETGAIHSHAWGINKEDVDTRTFQNWNCENKDMPLAHLVKEDNKVILIRRGKLGTNDKKIEDVYEYLQLLTFYKDGKITGEIQIKFLKSIEQKSAYGIFPVVYCFHIPLEQIKGRGFKYGKEGNLAVVPLQWSEETNLLKRTEKVEFNTPKGVLGFFSGEKGSMFFQDTRRWSKDPEASFRVDFELLRPEKGKTIEEGKTIMLNFSIQLPVEVKK
jgi:hypothetical protein